MKNLKRKPLIFGFLFLGLFLNCKKDDNNQKPNTEEPKSEISIPKSKGEIVKHTYYTLSYSEANEQAEWVYYKLSSEMLLGTQERTDNFRIDSLVSTGSATLSDYSGSGYDRGHLCPAGDMTISKTAMSESFYLSNMSPQNPSFNRGIWETLESIVRNIAKSEKEIYLVTGPIFKNNKGTIGINEVTVPGYYYKVIYSPSNQKMIGFVLPNEKGTKDITNYAIIIDSIESYTGIDFFPLLSDELEKKLESNIDITKWNLKQ